MIYIDLFLTFLKIGTFTIGGGYAMLPLIQEAVIQKDWMTTEEIVNFIAVSESTPGPFAINISTYIGAETGGLIGACAATLGVVLPSFVIILIIAKFFKAFSSNRYVKGCLAGLRPAVVGLIAASVVSVGASVFFPDGFFTEVFKSYWFYVSAFIFLLMLVLEIKKLSPIIIIVLSAVLGILAGYLPRFI